MRKRKNGGKGEPWLSKMVDNQQCKHNNENVHETLHPAAKGRGPIHRGTWPGLSEKTQAPRGGKRS